MAHTERFAVLKCVREAKTAVRDARFDEDLDPEQNASLEKVYLELDKLEEDLILSAVDERVDALLKTSQKLEEAAAKIKKDIKKLAKIAEKVEKAAKVLKILVDITKKAGSLIA